MKTRTIIEYILAALVVLILGAFSGWYFFLHSQTQTTIANDRARGYRTPNTLPATGGGSSNSYANASSAPQGGSAPTAPSTFFSRLLSAITGRGTGVSLPPKQSSAGSFGEASDSVSTSTPSGTTAATPTKRSPQLWHVEAKPVAGIAFIKSGKIERLRYVERATGYVYEAGAETGIVTRLTNTLAPKIYEAIPTAQGRIIERSLDDTGRVSTSIGVIGVSVSTTSTATTSVQTLSSIALPKDITHIAPDPRSGALFYLVNDASGAGGFRSEWNGAKPKRIFGSVITNWHPTWLSDGRIILVQAAADSVPGYAYELGSTGTLNLLLRAIPGLTLLPSTSGAMLYGQSNAGVLTLFAQASPSATPTTLPIKTIADKCVWTPDLSAQSAGTNRSPVGIPNSAKTSNGASKNLVAYCAVPQGLVSQNFLDDWYRGAVHSADALWRVDAGSGNAELVYTPETGTSIDVQNPTIDSTGSYIAFMNAADQSLWLLRINK